MAVDPVSLARVAELPGAGHAVGVGASGKPTAAGGFGSMVEQLVSAVESSNAQANTSIDGMVNKTGDVHDAMIALQRSELALQLAVQVRNKLVQAYQDVMRMPI
jgi:flagellar hook-basal body complex protein FliE